MQHLPDYNNIVANTSPLIILTRDRTNGQQLTPFNNWNKIKLCSSGRIHTQLHIIDFFIETTKRNVIKRE